MPVRNSKAAGLVLLEVVFLSTEVVSELSDVSGSGFLLEVSSWTVSVMVSFVDSFEMRNVCRSSLVSEGPVVGK